MTTAAWTTVEEYLHTTYRPDQDFLDGQLIERNAGEYDHSNLQGALIGWLFQRQREWRIRVLPEQRSRISSTRFRIPDICVISREQAIEPVLTHAPLICIEVLSKDDTLRSLQERIDDYRSFGVPNLGTRSRAAPRQYLSVRWFPAMKYYPRNLGISDSHPTRQLFELLD